MTHYIAFDPEEAQKAAAFVKALSSVEDRFGYRLRIGAATPVVIDGVDTNYAVARPISDGPLALALEARP